jgi:hypothetical protein
MFNILNKSSGRLIGHSPRVLIDDVDRGEFSFGMTLGRSLVRRLYINAPIFGISRSDYKTTFLFKLEIQIP